MTKQYEWLTEDPLTFLGRGYLAEGQTVPERVNVMGQTAEDILKIEGFKDKFVDYFSRGWFGASTPIWINFGTDRGLGISCFNSHISDSVYSFLKKQAEVGMMTKLAGGTSGYFGDVRARGAKISTGGKAEGTVEAMKMFDNVTNSVNQGAARRGHFAAYLPIDHGDIEEFLKIKSEGHDIQEMSIGVCVSDDWFKAMIDGDKEKRSLWAKVIKKRFETGYPYVFFSDNVNNTKPQVYKDKDYQINGSNMCAEIMLPSKDDESFVCDLSAMNLAKWEEWKDTDAVEVMAFFLDAVMSEFIEKTKDNDLMLAPHNFAKRHRALGIGAMGWHDLLQSKMIPWESMEAKMLNIEVFSSIHKQAEAATKKMAELFGEPEVLKGYGRRNTTMMAVAPNTSSSFIIDKTSPSIEPLNSNYFTKDLSKGKFPYKNKNLQNLLEEKGQNTREVWSSILDKGGSVQHLDFLSQHEKDVFKTFGEISQKEIIIQAAARQKYIDQGQSLNIMIPPEADPREVNQLMIFAWEQGVKTLYYQRSANPSQELARSILSCSSCEG